MKRIPTILLFSLPLATSCLGRRGGGAAGDADSLAMTGIVYPFTIDVSGDYPMESVSFQEVLGELEYVALETSPECLISDNPGWDAPIVTDDYIFIKAAPNPVLRFSRDGKFLNRVGNYGRGPGEFLSAMEMCVNDRTQEVFVIDILSHAILVYGYDGKYKRTLRTDHRKTVKEMRAISDSTMLVSNSSNGYHTEALNPFQVISSRDGSVIKSLLSPVTVSDAEIPFDVQNNYSQEDQSKGYSLRGIGFMAIVGGPGEDGKILVKGEKRINTSDAGVELNSFVADTVYVLSGAGELTPRWVKSPSSDGDDLRKRRYSSLVFEDSRFALFFTVGNGISKGYMVDKTTGAVTCSYLYNADIDHERTRDNRIIASVGSTDGNRFAMGYQSVQLVAWLEEGKLTGPLAALAATLKEDDNPVLVIQKNL